MELLILASLRASHYVLIAVGFALVFGSCRVLNLMHGSFVMLGAYASYAWLVAIRGVGAASDTPIVGLLGVLAAGSFTAILGWLFFRGLQATGRTRPSHVLAISVAGNLFISQLLQYGFGTEGLNVAPIVRGRVVLGGATVPLNDLLMPPLAIASVCLLWFWLHRSRSGIALRAVADDDVGARLVGIDSDRFLAVAVGIAAFLAGLAGAISAPSQPLLPTMWVSPLLLSFAVVVFGGRGSVWGAFIAACLVAFAETLTAWYVDEAASRYVALVMITIGLWVLPTGLMGGREHAIR